MPSPPTTVYPARWRRGAGLFYNPGMNGLRLGLLVSLAAIVASACSSPSFKPRRIVAEPFLANAGRLDASSSGLPRVYRSTDGGLPASPRILVESPSIWRSIEVPVLAVDEDDLDRLARALHEVVSTRLQPVCDVELALDPGVLRLRLAITEPAESWVVFETFTVHLPREKLASEHDALAPSTASFVDGASIDVELSDPATGRVLLAATGSLRRDGDATTPTWTELTGHFARWADALAGTLRANATKDGAR